MHRAGDAKQCRNRGGQYPHQNGKQNCPAYGKKCHHCSKIGHFAKYCLSKRKETDRQKADINEMCTKPDSNNTEQFNSKQAQNTHTDDEFTFQLYDKQKQPQVTVSKANIPIRVIIDSGSTVNIINDFTFRAIKRNNSTVSLQQSNSKMYPYGTDKPLTVLGQNHCMPRLCITQENAYPAATHQQFLDCYKHLSTQSMTSILTHKYNKSSTNINYCSKVWVSLKEEKSNISPYYITMHFILMKT